MRKSHLPIAQPCHENWDAMDRVERGRFCHSCAKQVFDLSAMTEREAKGVLNENAGSRICVRYCHDDAGKIRFRPERVASAAAIAIAMAACTPHEPTMGRQTVGTLVAEPMKPEPEPKPEPIEHELKGDVAVVPDEPDVMGELAVEPPPDPPVAPIEPPAPTREVMGEAMPEEPCAKKPAAKPATKPLGPAKPAPGLQKL